MRIPVTVLTPTGTLGFGAAALARGTTMAPDVIAVDAGSTDPARITSARAKRLYLASA